MKIYKSIFVIFFFLLLLFPVIFMNFKKDQISKIDNSKLPEFFEVKDIYTMEEYISKRLGFRQGMINTYIYLNDFLLKKLVHPSYTYGKDGYVFFKTQIEMHDDEYLNTFANLVKNMQDYVTERNKYFLFVLNPTKISVYEQYLPSGYNFQNYRLEYLKQQLDNLGVNYLDNTECLIEASKTNQVFNVKYDAGHWNDVGAYLGINNIYDKLQKDGIDVEKLNMEDYKVRKKSEKYLPISEFKINEKILIYRNKKYETIKKYKNWIEVNSAHKYFSETKNPLKNNNLLFFRGSYMNNKEKFVVNQFGDSYFVHNYENSINFDYYYNIADPDIVLFETVEYAIGEGYYSSEAIKNKKYNEVYDKFKDLEFSEDLIKINVKKLARNINRKLKTNAKLTKIKIDASTFEYAYLKVDDKIYDFCYDKDIASISLDSEKLKQSLKIEIIVISKDLKQQQIIKIK